jgi:prepilin signal peptidase PulO-like enzyme (type II secretory pathway)
VPQVSQLTALAGIIACAVLLVRMPRTLFTEISGAKPSLRTEAILILALGCVGLAAYFSGLGRSVEGRAALAVALMTLAAVVYSDFSFLAVPDLYSLMIVLLAWLAPWKYGPQEAAFGLLVCGGLVAILAFLWQRFTQAEGFGLGDVKLAGAVGALLSAQPGLFALAAAAVLAVAYALIFRKARLPEDGEPARVPYGAALALASAVLLAKGMT